MSDHEKFQSQLEDYITHKLSGHECEVLEIHLLGCPDCEQALTRLELRNFVANNREIVEGALNRAESGQFSIKFKAALEHAQDKTERALQVALNFCEGLMQAGGSFPIAEATRSLDGNSSGSGMTSEAMAKRLAKGEEAHGLIAGKKLFLKLDLDLKLLEISGFDPDLQHQIVILKQEADGRSVEVFSERPSSNGFVEIPFEFLEIDSKMSYRKGTL